MKRINKYLAAGLLGLVATTSCKKLDLNPADRIALSQAFKSVKDAQSWDTGVLALFRNRQYGTYAYFSDVQSDELNATLDFGNRNGSPHRWDMQSDDQTISPMWQAYYYAIANINQALAGYKTITPANATETAQLNQYTGDLYFARAFYYHKLVTRWAKPYETATAATDLGVPLVLTYDPELKPARATVKAVYDQILADIAQAKTLLGGIAGKQGATTFNIDVVTALEARVRLYMHDNAGAYAAAQSLIAPSTGATKYPLINTEAGLKAYWYNDAVQETIFQSAATLTETPNTNNIYLQYSTGKGAYDPDFVPTQGILEYYQNGDIRKSTYFASLPVKIGTTAATLQLVAKYPGNPALYTGAPTATNYAHAPKVFRIAEMYLIAAEAAQAAGNEGNALIALNALRTARGEGLFAGTGTLLRDEIRSERTRELAFEGFRLDDLTRWHLGMTRFAPQTDANGILNTGSLYTTLTQPADAPKFIWGIPSNDITINTNLVQNPGW